MDGEYHWQFWIDRGGTFADIVALRPDGKIETARLQSENPEQYNDAAAEGIRQTIEDWTSGEGGKAPIEAVALLSVKRDGLTPRLTYAVIQVPW